MKLISHKNKYCIPPNLSKINIVKIELLQGFKYIANELFVLIL